MSDEVTYRRNGEEIITGLVVRRVPAELTNRKTGETYPAERLVIRDKAGREVETDAMRKVN